VVSGLIYMGVEGKRRRLEAEVDGDHDGWRLDQWLAQRFTYRSRSSWVKEIRSGRVTLDGRRCRPSALVHEQSQVCWQPEPEPEPDVDFACSIIHEDDEVLAINKSGNLPCHPAGVYFANTLWAWLQEQEKSTRLVNRLDRETSGVVVVAQTSAVAAQMMRAFEAHQVEKTYLAVVHGSFLEERRVKGSMINDGDSPVRKKRKFVIDVDGGESAESSISAESTGEEFSLVSVTPKTGRLHQIRATLLALGHPIVGDKLYGVDDNLYLSFIEGRLSPSDRAKLRLKRQALHAWRTTLPVGDRSVTLNAPLPRDLVKFCCEQGLDLP
jgi:RluA family pseudouridine synthase